MYQKMRISKATRQNSDMYKAHLYPGETARVTFGHLLGLALLEIEKSALTEADWRSIQARFLSKARNDPPAAPTTITISSQTDTRLRSLHQRLQALGITQFPAETVALIMEYASRLGLAVPLPSDAEAVPDMSDSAMMALLTDSIINRNISLLNDVKKTLARYCIKGGSQTMKFTDLTLEQVEELRRKPLSGRHIDHTITPAEYKTNLQHLKSLYTGRIYRPFVEKLTLLFSIYSDSFTVK